VSKVSAADSCLGFASGFASGFDDDPKAIEEGSLVKSCGPVPAAAPERFSLAAVVFLTPEKISSKAVSSVRGDGFGRGGGFAAELWCVASLAASVAVAGASALAAGGRGACGLKGVGGKKVHVRKTRQALSLRFAHAQHRRGAAEGPHRA